MVYWRGRITFELPHRQFVPTRGPIPPVAAEQPVAHEQLNSEIHGLAPRGAESLTLLQQPLWVEAAAHPERGCHRPASRLDGLNVEEHHYNGKRHRNQCL